MGQSAEGDQNVQIQHVAGSTIQITYGGRTRKVPLQPAIVAVGRNVSSPARLVRARSGVLPYAARDGLLAELDAWAQTAVPFGVCLVGGRGGSGKTRLGVEVCEHAREAGWLAGVLTPSTDQGALEALADAPTRRLVVVDYAETRGEQLELIVPLLAAHASDEDPVRVLLLVRARPRHGEDWTVSLRHRSDALDALLDDVDVRLLEDLPLNAGEREGLFIAAADALAAHSRRPAVTDPPDILARAVFASPLLVVIAAYLAVHGERDVPTTRTGLLDELLAHEQRYWKTSAKHDGLDADAVLHRRVVAFATLAGATSEREATDLLRLIPDLSDAPAKDRGRLARWAGALYPPGPGFWSPIEPDLLAEHLVVGAFGEDLDVLAGVLERDSPQAVVQPLDLYARTAPDHPDLAERLGAILTQRLASLCTLAAAQAANETDLDLLLGDTTLAAALTRALTVIDIDPGVLPAILDSLPQRPDLILGSLALTLTMRLTAADRRLAAANPAAYEPDLAMSLNNLSNRLADAGRRDEALTAIEEAVTIRRRLAAANPAAYEPHLATSLNNLSVRLADAGRRDEAEQARVEAAWLHHKS